MRKLGIAIADNSGTLAVLACELDNEHMWEELNNYEFQNTIISDLSVEISEDKYIYTIKSNELLKICFIDLESGEHLCDYITLCDVVNSLKNNASVQNDFKITASEDNGITLNHLGNTVTVKEIKLIAINGKKSLVQFIM